MKRAPAAMAKVAQKSARATDFPPEASMGHLVRDTHRELARVLQKHIGGSGITVGMWYFLRALWERDGLTQRELSRKVRMMEPSAVVALNKVERLGLVMRVRNSDDRRKVNVFLTDRGRKLREQLLPRAMEVNRIALHGLTKAETETLRKLLARVKDNLEAEANS